MLNRAFRLSISLTESRLRRQVFSFAIAQSLVILSMLSEKLKALFVVSRPEFLPANLASLVIAIAWALGSIWDFNWHSAALAVLSFGIITAVSAFGAQLNSLGDYELDLREPRKSYLTTAMDKVGKATVKKAVIAELLISMVLLVLLLLIEFNPVLVVLWVVGFALAYLYSMPPLRLKRKPWITVVVLMLVLCYLPILFVYYSMTSVSTPLFLLFLIGQGLTVYSIIIPTETRDYFGDKAMNVTTFTVKVGLVKASLVAMGFLVSGLILSGAAFALQLVGLGSPLFGLFLLVMVVADVYVFKQFRKLYALSREYVLSGGLRGLAERIVDLSANNPKWIMMVSQPIVLMSIAMLIAKSLA